MKKVQLLKLIKSVEQTTYPNEYQAVLEGDAYWYPHPIDIKGYAGKFWDLHQYREFDMDRPRCYTCGRFVKKGDWWRNSRNGPCMVCNESLWGHHGY